MTGDEMAEHLSGHLQLIDMTQAEFARKVGMSEKHVSKVLTGKASAPIATLDYWAFALGMRWSVRLVKL